jgi:hypothetical protein
MWVFTLIKSESRPVLSIDATTNRTRIALFAAGFDHLVDACIAGGEVWDRNRSWIIVIVGNLLMRGRCNGLGTWIVVRPMLPLLLSSVLLVRSLEPLAES